MKKFIAIAVLACMTAAFAGCSQENTQAEESKGQISIEESVVSEQESSSDESSTAESSAEESSKTESSQQSGESESSVQESSKQESSKQESSKPQQESKAQTASSQPTQQVIVQQQVVQPQEQQTQPQQQPQPQPQETQPSQTQEAPPVITGSINAGDLAVTLNNRTVTLMTAMGGAASVFGEPSSVESLPSCLGESKDDDKLYHYNGYEIQTLNDGTEKIYYIHITGAGISTSKGIICGSSIEDIEAAYGTPTNKDDMICTYVVDNGKYSLDFFLEGGKVSEITIAANMVGF